MPNIFEDVLEVEDATKFDKYRGAIWDKYGVDISKYSGKEIPGGRSEGHNILEYDLEELLLGINIEFEHSDNPFVALEISMDHLEEWNGYYSKGLIPMEQRFKKEEKAASNPKEK